MPIPGAIDPVPVPRAVTPREDGRVDLMGLSRPQIGGALEEAGLAVKQAKLRSKQLVHWLSHRGETDFAAMPDLAKPIRGWLAERFAVGRPEVVEAQGRRTGKRQRRRRSAAGTGEERWFTPDAQR